MRTKRVHILHIVVIMYHIPRAWHCVRFVSLFPVKYLRGPIKYLRGPVKYLYGPVNIAVSRVLLQVFLDFWNRVRTGISKHDRLPYMLCCCCYSMPSLLF